VTAKRCSAVGRINSWPETGVHSSNADTVPHGLIEAGTAMSGSKKRRVRDIYVALLDKGNDAWRRVEAVHEGEDSYRIISENADAKERWEYTTGECVRCRSTTLPSGERVLVATERLRSRTDRGDE
jgi:hypothetical protein